MRETSVYAFVKTRRHQYRVAIGDQLDVEKIEVEAGQEIELGEVLLVSGDDNQVTVGEPLVAGARVTATVVNQHRGENIVVFQYKANKR